MSKAATTDRAILNPVKTRWSPRAFSDKPVSREDVLTMLDAARWASSAYNEQPWRFLVATSENPEEHAKLAQGLNEFNRAWAASAPVLMVVVARNKFSHNETPNAHARYDAGQAAATLVLQATELGLYAHQMGGILPDYIRETYNVPAAFDIVAGIAIGHLGDPSSLPEQLAAGETAPRTRKNLSELAFSGSWDASF